MKFAKKTSKLAGMQGSKSKKDTFIKNLRVAKR